MKRASEVPPLVLSSGSTPRVCLTRGDQDLGEPAGRRQERLAGDLGLELVGAPDLVAGAAHPGDEVLGAMPVVEADVEARARTSRNDVARLVADIDAGDLQARGLEVLAAGIERLLGEAPEHGQKARDGIVGKVGIRDVALRAGDGQRCVEAAAAPDLGHLAEPRRVGRLADQAGIDDLAAPAHPLEHLDRTVHGRAFLIARDQQAERAGKRAAAAAKEAGRGGDKARDRPLHVGRAAPIKRLIHDLGGEGIDAPALARAHGHDVGVPGEAKVGRRRPVARVEVVNGGRAARVES